MYANKTALYHAQVIFHYYIIKSHCIPFKDLSNMCSIAHLKSPKTNNFLLKIIIIY